MQKVIITRRAYARAGLLGNPSDGYFGKTISLIVKNFRAEVVLYHTPDLEILPSERDQSKFESIEELFQDVEQHGYYGGVRLIKATVKKFYEYCTGNGIVLPKKNFTIKYKSNIPRQVGLAGSSAIVTATLRALMAFYGVDIPRAVQPNLILSVETDELNIPAGLQDRVIQVYEGVVYMDFAKEIMETRGHGEYEPLGPHLLPQLYLAYRTDLAEGTEKFHNNIRQRFEEGDPVVVGAMKKFAELAAEGRELLLAGQREELGKLMDENFDLRASIYRISERNIEMVERARSVGASAKFTGSGGAIIGTCDNHEMYEKLEETMREGGFTVTRPIIV